MLHFPHVRGTETLRPRPENRSHQPMVAIRTDHYGLTTNVADLQEALVTHNLNPRVVAIVTRTNAGDCTQSTTLETNADHSRVVEVRSIYTVFLALEV